MQVHWQQSPVEAASSGARLAPPAAATAASSASSNTQHSNICKHGPGKRTVDALQLPHSLPIKRPRQASAAAYAVDSSATTTTTTTTSSSSSSSADDSADTAASVEQPLTLEEVQQLYAAVSAGQHSLSSTLLMLLQCRGEKTFLSFLQYLTSAHAQQQQQQQQQEGEEEGAAKGQQSYPVKQQQQQQQAVRQQLLTALSANNSHLLSRLLQLLSHPDIVTCYSASAAFQGLVEAVGPHQVLAAVLAAPHGVLLLLAALNEHRLRQAYQQGYVISVTYAGRAVLEPLCSGTVGYLISNARKQDVEELMKQLVTALMCQDECAVAAAMALVIVARNAAAGVETLLQHTPLLLAAVQQHCRVSRRILLTLRVMAETAAVAAAGCSNAPTAAASLAAAMAQHDLTPLAKLMLSTAACSGASFAADVLYLLARAAPAQSGLVQAVPTLIEVYCQQGPVTLLGAKAVQILQLIRLGGTAGTSY